MTRRIAVWVFTLLAAAPLLAQVEPLTDEISVAVSPEPHHYGLLSPDVAISGPQEFLVSWDVSYQRYNGSQLVDWGAAISGRKVSFEGQPVGEDLVLEPFERRTYQGSHSLAANASGRFAVLWDEIDEPSGLMLRRFSPGGSPLDTRRLDDAMASIDDYFLVSSLAMDPLGRIAAAWTEAEPETGNPSNVRMQLFDASGEPETDPLRIPRAAPSAYPALAMDGRGITILAYATDGPLAAQIEVRRFDAAGSPLGNRIVVAGGRNSSQLFPAVAANAGGRFVVAWVTLQGIFARIFDPAGRKVGPVVRVTTRDSFDDTYPDVAIDSQGNFVVAWVGATEHGRPRYIQARLFNRDGVPQGGVLQVDPSQALEHIFPWYAPAVAMTDAGTFLVTWTDFPEDNLSHVKARLFAALRDDDRCVWRHGSFLCDTARDGDLSHFEVLFGVGGDRPLLADFDGDGDDDACVRRGGLFLCDTARDGGAPELVLRFGNAFHTPLAGDLDGDGDDDPCVRRGRVFLCDTAHNGGTAEVRIPLGARTDVPVLGDVDGDGDDDPCIWQEPSETLFCDLDHDGAADFSQIVDSQAGDRPLLGDVDGDGDADFCLARGEDLFCDPDRDGVLTQETLATEPGDVLLLGNVDGV